MQNPKQIEGLGEIAGGYEVLLCDVWGVLHNGRAAYPGAAEALNEFRGGGGLVVLISNAPRPAASVERRLADVGVAPCYDAIVTSGDLARALVVEYQAEGKTGCHIGPPKDAPLLEGLGFTLPDAREGGDADYVLLSGLYDDASETPDDYAEMVEAFLARGLPMICANPDRQVQYGEHIIYCAGAVAEKYEQGGGEVVWVGKPYPAVYEYARGLMAELGAAADARILAIGDGVKTDLPGAAAAGLDSLFIAGGLAGVSSAECGALLAQENTFAAFVMQHLVW